jgi:hypothetical protein
MGVGSVDPQPFANRHPGHHDIGSGEESRVGDIKERCGATEVIGDISEEIALANQNRDRVTVSEIMQQWQKFMAHTIAKEHRIQIGWISKGLKSLDRTNRFGLAPSQFHNGVSGAGTDSGETIGTSTA